MLLSSALRCRFVVNGIIPDWIIKKRYLDYAFKPLSCVIIADGWALIIEDDVGWKSWFDSSVMDQVADLHTPGLPQL
ncbi:hypothetical protein LSM04_007420 [Trypanosoma melophagium]|uniref:uncharacterized protein n=1 Tax=Trypanosoma melophagium TaxID=715481 RepID=UPI00351A3216|nr:hypothetical protein LSM04_007420 [Trypanosoma melophagium]